MSNKQKYPSHLGATRKITASNYLAEYIIIRHAASRNIKLPNRIWDKKRFSKNLQWRYWCGLYYGELKRASGLLEKFELNDILEALKDGPGKVILSLQNTKLKPLIVRAKEIRETIEANKETNELVIAEPTTLPRQSYGQKSKLRKLR
jgi:hypothetical protein